MSEDRVAVTAAEVWPEDAEDVEEGVVVNWFVREGATVDAGDTLCEIQVEKVSVDLLAPVAGELQEVVRGEDEEFAREDTVAWIRPS